MFEYQLAKRNFENTSYNILNGLKCEISEAKYAYNGEAAGDDTQALRHLKEVSKSNLNVARKNPVTTTDYGFIDMPPLPPSSQNSNGRGEHEAKGGAGNNLGDKSRITADEDMIAGKVRLSVTLIGKYVILCFRKPSSNLADN